MLGLVAIGATALVATVLQSTIFARLLPLTGVIPNLMLVLVVVLGVRHQGTRGVAAAFLLGYILDTFVGTTLGVHAFAFTVVYAVVVMLAAVVRVDHTVGLLLTVALGTCVHALVVVGVARVTHGGPSLAEAMRHGLGEAMFTAALSPAVVAFVEWQERLLGAES